MQTTAIRRWLKYTGCSHAPDCMHCAALREVEAIEKAAGGRYMVETFDTKGRLWKRQQAGSAREARTLAATIGTVQGWVSHVYDPSGARIGSYRAGREFKPRES